MTRSEQPLFTAAQIRARVSELAAQLSRELAGRDLVALIVLKGAVHFGSDLVRAMTVPMAVDFVQARSYHGTASTGKIEMLGKPTQDLKGRHVLIIEDILDTGVTARALVDFVRDAGAGSVTFCALFDKPSRRKVPVQADLRGFDVPDVFIVGYGLDHDERYRELADVYTLT
jgi:hypoxanthine phosphoribosyltransferase